MLRSVKYMRNKRERASNPELCRADTSTLMAAAATADDNEVDDGATTPRQNTVSSMCGRKGSQHTYTVSTTMPAGIVSTVWRTKKKDAHWMRQRQWCVYWSVDTISNLLYMRRAAHRIWCAWIKCNRFVAIDLEFIRVVLLINVSHRALTKKEEKEKALNLVYCVLHALLITVISSSLCIQTHKHVLYNFRNLLNPEPSYVTELYAYACCL